jgi:hypothetical protein
MERRTEPIFSLIHKVRCERAADEKGSQPAEQDELGILGEDIMDPLHALRNVFNFRGWSHSNSHSDSYAQEMVMDLKRKRAAERF